MRPARLASSGRPRSAAGWGASPTSSEPPTGAPSPTAGLSTYGYRPPTLWLAALGRPSPRLAALAQKKGWQAIQARYLLKQITAEDLLSVPPAAKTAKAREETLCEAHGMIGLQAERRGDLKRARAHYRRCLEAETTDIIYYHLARQRLQAGPGE